MNRANLPNQDPRPKRRRAKDNPYILSTVGIKTNQPHYYVSFPDAQGNQIRLEISESLYKLLDKFELEDLSFLNEVDNHYDRSACTFVISPFFSQSLKVRSFKASSNIWRQLWQPNLEKSIFISLLFFIKCRYFRIVTSA